MQFDHGAKCVPTVRYNAHMAKTNKVSTPLAIVALGVVFGDIGTSPLYALQAVFGLSGQNLKVTQENVYGIISLIIWSITLVVSIKFIGFIMRADNEGEGGIMALVTLIKGIVVKHKRLFIMLGIVGVALFYGDSIITPAISVLSAVEGLKVVAPNLGTVVVPVTIAILACLFWIQKYGTAAIGRFFGPTMLVWFLAIGLGGAWRVWQHPGVLWTLSPLTAISFFVDHPVVAFLSMTAVVLAITGAEALYADLGHFGRRPISQAWFMVVFPALALCYMGEGALVLHQPGVSNNVLVQLFPVGIRAAFVFLATVATLIASQSVISGAFSLTRQAVKLEFLPKMIVRHTSIRETGQIYMPFINFILFVLVVALVLGFGSSASLANAYGIAVSGTLAADTVLFLVVMRSLWRKPVVLVASAAIVFLPIDFLFVSSNMQKLLHGGIFPIVIGCLTLVVINTWTKGENIVDKERRAKEGSILNFIETLHSLKPPIKRLPGAAVYIGHHPDFTPLAFRATVEELHELPEKVVIITVQTTTAAHVPSEKRAVLDNFGDDDGISHLMLYYGYHDTVNIPKVLKSLRSLDPDLDFDVDNVAYFVSSSKIILTKRHNMARWRKSLYYLLYRNAQDTSDYYKLPVKQTEEMQVPITL
jgi:KUP system potassium uptake protein